MDNNGITQYWFPAAYNLFGAVDINNSQDTYYACARLDTALGVSLHKDYCARSASEDFPLEPEMKELLRKLKGPHGKTILKAYQIKHGVKNEEASV